MSKKMMRNAAKSVLASFMAVAVIVSGMVVMPETADAVETLTYAGKYEDKLVYQDMTTEFNKLWNAEEGQAQAPTMTGYVFGGWYQEDGTDSEGNKTYKALDEATAATQKAANLTEGIIAKFVPAYVLSIKAQIDENAALGASRTDDNLGSIRLISSVDCKDYQKVGFDILLANTVPLYKNSANDPLETTRIYTGLKVGNTTYEPEQIFGTQSEFLSVWRLDGFYADMDDAIINVTPYWVTKDGTKVEGLAKYAHVEDGYLDYISVPVNLCETAEVAAGLLTMTYPAGLTLVEDKVEFDGVFPGKEMTCYNDTENHTIKFVGNAATVNEAKKADGIYANLRFTVSDSTVYSGVGKGTFLNFAVTGEEFCDWGEEPVSVDAWNIQY